MTIPIQCDIVYRDIGYVAYFEVWDNGDRIYRYSTPRRMITLMDRPGLFRYGTDKLWITKKEGMM